MTQLNPPPFVLVLTPNSDFEARLAKHPLVIVELVPGKPFFNDMVS